MTRYTDPDLLLAILDTYTSGITNSLETVASMNGVSFRSVYSWLRDPEIILAEYMGEENISFGKAMNLARNVAKAITISRSLEDRVLNGLRVQVFHHGQPTYVDDEKAILIEDLDTREMLFGYRDGKMSEPMFFKRLKEAFPQLQNIRPRVEGGREYCLAGIRLRDTGPPTTVTKTFWLDCELTEMLGQDVILRDPITQEPVEAIEGEFPGW